MVTVDFDDCFNRKVWSVDHIDRATMSHWTSRALEPPSRKALYGTKGEPLGQGEDFPWDEHKQNFSMVFRLVWLSIWLSLLFEILFHALVLLVNLDIM